jgi:putative peptide zinc metalloprotease protein
MESAILGDGVCRSAPQTDSCGLTLWEWLREKLDVASYCPEAAPGVIVRQLSGRDGDYYILKNPATLTYFRLSDRDYFVWQLMNGSRTVKDLVVAFFLEHGSFAFARISSLVDGLRANLLLVDRPVNVYVQVRAQLQQRKLSYRLNRFWRAFLEKQFAVSSLDRLLKRAYRLGGRLLFTWPAQAAFLALTAVGLYCFFLAFNTGNYGVLSIEGSYTWGVVGLLVVNFASILIHEMSHGLTLAHYGRDVRRGGFMIYFGMPAFFVDTTDIWLESKRARLAVSWAGPYSGLILGGMASIVLVAWPRFALNALLFQFAFIAYLTVFVNLNPLLELDGYYLLMDGLEIPMLRRKSLEFARSGLWAKLGELRQRGESIRSALGAFSREERIFTVFGLLSAGWTAYAIFAGARFWQEQLAFSAGNLWAHGGDSGKLVLALVGVALSLPFVFAIGLLVVGLLRKAVKWVDRKGLFANTWGVAAMVAVATAAVAVATRALEEAPALPAIQMAVLAAAVAFSWWNAVESLGILPLGLLLGDALALLAENWLVPRAFAEPAVAGLGLVSCVSLVLAGLFLSHGRVHATSRRVGKVVLAVAAPLGVAVILWRALSPVTPPLSGNAFDAIFVLLSVLALTLVASAAVPFRRSRLGAAWLTLCLVSVSLVGAELLDWPAAVAGSLVVGVAVLHRIALQAHISAAGAFEASPDDTDATRLWRTFSLTAASMLAQLRETMGQGAALAVADIFNSYALGAEWGISIINGEPEDSRPGRLGLVERGAAYAGALTLLLDLEARQVGERWVIAALQRAYDGLPWEEREIGAEYLFPDVKRAEELSRELRAASQGYQALLGRMPLFATMDEVEIGLLASRVRSEHYRGGQVIIRQGDRGDRFYVVESGQVEVTVRDDRGVSEVVNRLRRGDFFGELALLHDVPRSATCRASMPTGVLSLSRRDFEQLVRARFSLREKLDQSLLWQQRYEPGDVIMRQGEPGKEFCVIESGRVRITATQDKQVRVLGERGPGEYVGEMALLLDIPRTATVTAITHVRALALTRHDFERLVAEHLYVSRWLERETSRRMIGMRRIAAPTT